MNPDVVVVGAGPTGLATALSVHDHGGTVRVLERRSERFRPSRAMILHIRTLEMLRPFGVVEELLSTADTEPTAELHLGGRTVTAPLRHLQLADTAYPHLTLLRQADLERVLTDALETRGVHVRRDTTVLDVTGDEHVVRVVVASDGGPSRIECGRLVGCDGQDSVVRRTAGIGWNGGPYREEVLLADLELDGDLSPGVLHVAPDRDGLVFLFALGEQASWRLLATRPADPDAGGRPPAYGQDGGPVEESLLQDILAGSGLDAKLTSVAWSARVPLQHRLASRYRVGRVFVAGDAAHAWSPAAGQGMNTGIQDGLNLGWKLALAARSPRATPELIDSYQAERRAVAQWTRALTHAVFFAEASTHPLPGLLRDRVVPLGAPAVPVLLGRQRLLAAGVRVLSGLLTRHRRSPIALGDGAVDGVRAGDRLPDRTVSVAGRPRRLHDLTARPGIHLLLSRDADVGRVLPVAGDHVVPHRLDRPGPDAVAVRPDGYVGCTSSTTDHASLRAWLDLLGVE